MGNRAKLALFVAAISLIPSISQFAKGYLVLTGLLTHALLALAFGLLVTTLFSAGAAIFKIQNMESQLMRAAENAEAAIETTATLAPPPIVPGPTTPIPPAAGEPASTT
jgi:ABC-type multidrug transport system fused ATPase/permease subunit